jgi:ATP-dependent DNA helicase RecG
MTPLDQSVSVLKGVGTRKMELLRRLGIQTVGDLLTYFPRAYEDRTYISDIRSATLNEPCCILAMPVSAMRHTKLRNGRVLSKVTAADGTGQVTICFFNQRHPSLSLQMGQEYVFYGKIETKNHEKVLYNPLFEPLGASPVLTRRIVSIYGLTAGVTSASLSRMVAQALALAGDYIPEILPDGLRAFHHLPHRSFALHAIHSPRSMEELALARRRLVWEEFLLFSLGLGLLKQRRVGKVGHSFSPVSIEPFYRVLPFSLTAAQRRVISEITADCGAGRPMNRLVQGDVGSGKTMVAAAAIYLAAQNGLQAALMAPTELLARQHQNTLAPLLAACGIRVGLLTGSMSAGEKRAVLQSLQSGELDLLIGTHALLSDGVSFPRLGLVITDEQHRFGVHQRVLLAEKGEAPHILVLSATPIPRTLALILYGDLDISILDELPPSRQPVDTFLIGEDKRGRLYQFVRKLVAAGRQAYFVCPVIEEGESSLAQAKAVNSYTKTLQQNVFPDLQVSCVHGRMSPKEKETVMEAFAAGKIDLLVSTTVIEVGVDVPNAALMVVENAERFGLSQLHQLRGRVGRGTHKSYCVLLSPQPTGETLTRLKALCKTRDGFQIAEEDLKLRGPGDFFGMRQHGLPQLKIGNLACDLALLQEAQGAASQLLLKDPTLSSPKHCALKAQVHALFAPTDGGRN